MATLTRSNAKAIRSTNEQTNRTLLKLTEQLYSSVDPKPHVDLSRLAQKFDVAPRNPSNRDALDALVCSVVHAEPAHDPLDLLIEAETQTDDNYEDTSMNTQTNTQNTPNTDTLRAAREADALRAKLDEEAGELPEPKRYEVGETLFDLIDTLSSVGQRTVLRAIGNSATARAIYAADWLYTCMASSSPNITSEMIDDAQTRTGRLSDLAAWCRYESDTLKRSEYDEVMTPAAMFDFLADNEPRVQDRANDIFEAQLEMLGLTEDEKKLDRAARQAILLKQAKRRQAEMRTRRDDILSQLDQGDDSQFEPHLFDARNHLGFLEKAYDKVREAARRALRMTGMYPNAEDDATDLAADAKALDRAIAQFRRRNRDELVDVVTRI